VDAQTLALPLLVATVDERPAFAALVAEHRGELLGKARQLTRGRIDAEDLVQDALERAFRRYDSLREGSRARAWLFTILTHTFIDRVRRLGSEPASDSIDDVPLAAPPPTPRPAWEALSAAQLHDAVARLPTELSEVYRLHAFDGLDYNQLADRLALPKSTVGTRLLRARKQLRALLAGQIGEEPAS
jgi:RNA polymerase sigma-70 factor (ECF subfamily)